MRVLLLLCCLVALPALAEPMGAEDEPTAPRGGVVDPEGLVRLRVQGLRPFAVDELGTVSGREGWLSSRVLGGVVIRPFEGVTFGVGLEALTGQLAGSWTSLGDSVETPFRMSRRRIQELLWVLPRSLYGRYDGPKGTVTAGIQTFGWGTGMLSNSGDGEPLFGDAWQGGVVARVGGAVTPWRTVEKAGLARGLAFFGAFDFVLRDDNAFVYRGDLAVAGIGGLRLRAPRGEVGLLASLRYQRDRRDPQHAGQERPETLAVPLDLHARWRLLPEDGPVHLTLEGEAAMIGGRTRRSYGEETVEGSRILSAGGLLRARLDFDRARTSAQVEIGYASGDRDPRDGVTRTFTMNSDHNVGLILFDQVLPLLTARAVDRVADPELTGRPAAGLRHAIAQGGVHNALYVHPTVRVRPVHTLDVRIGWVLALAPAPVVDLYQTARNGGWSAGWGGSTGGRLYGNEVDLGVHWTLPLPARLSVRLGVEGGVFVPGDVFDGLALGVPATVRGRMDFRF